MEIVESVAAFLDCFYLILTPDASCLDGPLASVVTEKLLYLGCFLRLTVNRCIEHESIKDLFTYAENVAYAALYLCFLDLAYNKEKDDYQSHELDSEFSKLLEMICPMNAIRPELRQIYLNLLIESKTSQSKIPMDAKSMSYLVDALKEDLQELLSHDSSLKTTFDDQVPWLQQGLSYLSRFLFDIAFKDTLLEEFSSLQSRIEALIIEAAIMIYSSWYDKEGMKNTEIHHMLFLLQLKFNHVEVEINLIQLPYSKATIMAPLKYLIDSVQEKLILLGTFLMDSSEQCKEQTKITDFLALIQSVTNEAWSIVQSLSCDSKQEDMAREINHLRNKLLLKFMLIEAVIRQMRPNISTSSTLDHPTINLLNFLRIDFHVIDSYFNMLKSSERQSFHIPTVDEVLMGFHEELIFLRASLMDVLTQHTKLKELHDPLMCAEATSHKLEQISGSCYGSFVDGSSTQQMKLPLSDQLQEVETVKVELRKVFFQLLDASPCDMADGEGLINFLLNRQVGLLNYDDCSISFLKNQILEVKDKAEYLGSFLADIVQDRDMHQELKDLVRCVQDINYVCFFHVEGWKPAWYCMLYLSDMKQFLKHIEEEVKKICLKVPHSLGYSFPKTDGLGFFNCFLHKLEELLRSELDSVIELKQQIESVKESLLCLKSLINHYAENLDEHDEVYGCIITSVTEMAYKAEYVIDSCLVSSHPLWYKVLWISEFVDNIKLENQAVSQTCGRKMIDVTAHKVANTSVSLVPSISGNTTRTNEEMEGFQEAMDKIKDQILRRSSHLDVISIVGMAGIGKTTLAEKIYNDLIATPHFDVHAKCRVTQVYSWKELLLSILNDVLGPQQSLNIEQCLQLAPRLFGFVIY